jgi:hypothetical protein
LERGFDDQYILLEAKEGAAVGSSAPDGVKELVERCRRFGEVASREVDRWRQVIAEFADRDQTVVLWGAGSKAVGFLSALALDEAVSAVVDVNPFKQGTFLPGSAHEIVSPDSLQDLSPDLVVVMNPIYAAEIGEMLAGRELHPQLASLSAVYR